MKKIIFAILCFWVCGFGGMACGQAIDPPSGYTTNYKLRMWSEGAYPGADSVNQNLIDIDAVIKLRARSIDSLVTAFKVIHEYPSGVLKNGVVSTSHIYDNAVTAPKLGSSVFGTYFKPLYTGPTLTGWTIYVDQSQFSADSIRIKACDLTLTGIHFNGAPEINLSNVGNDQGSFKINTINGERLVYWADGDYWRFSAPIDVTGNINIDTNSNFKKGNVTGYLSSAFGTRTPSGFTVKSEVGGDEVELDYMTLTINGVQIKVLVVPEGY